MKKGIVFIFALFLMLTSFNGENRIVEQNGINFQEKASDTRRAPEILVLLKTAIVYRGYPVTFSAKVSTSDCDVIWFKNGEKIEENLFFKFSFNDENIATFVIMSVLPEDAGEYRVKFRNNYGEVTSTARLFVMLPD